VLGPHDLRRWWKERMEGKLPENPSTPEGVRKSQEDWKTRNMQKRQLMRGVKDQMNEETGYLVSSSCSRPPSLSALHPRNSSAQPPLAHLTLAIL
jgi:hypothetical protein